MSQQSSPSLREQAGIEAGQVNAVGEDGGVGVGGVGGNGVTTPSVDVIVAPVEVVVVSVQEDYHKM